MTLKDNMTSQEVYDHVCTHLLTQMKKSFGPKPGTIVRDCLYRGPDSTMCAAGCLIKDEEYDPDMEGVPVCSSTDNNKFPTRIMSNGHIVATLQRVHDNYDVNQWRDRLIQVGEIFNLDTRVPYAFA